MAEGLPVGENHLIPLRDDPLPLIGLGAPRRSACAPRRVPPSRRDPMKRLHLAARLALAALVLLMLAVPVVAKEQVPFRGRLEGDVTTTPQPPVLHVVVDGTGQATHL